MKRRAFIALLGGAAAAAAPVAIMRVAAQQTAKLPRVGLLAPRESIPPANCGLAPPPYATIAPAPSLSGGLGDNSSKKPSKNEATQGRESAASQGD